MHWYALNCFLNQMDRLNFSYSSSLIGCKQWFKFGFFPHLRPEKLMNQYSAAIHRALRFSAPLALAISSKWPLVVAWLERAGYRLSAYPGYCNGYAKQHKNYN
jgi:hypothetical protein